MLAVVIEVTRKLTPTPRFAQCVLASFDAVEKAAGAVAGIIAAGIIPAGLVMMDQPAAIAAEEFVRAGDPLDANALLICESVGPTEDVAEEIARIEAVANEFAGPDIELSQSARERELLSL